LKSRNDNIKEAGRSLCESPNFQRTPADAPRFIVASQFEVLYAIHMKRTNLMLDEDLLEEVVRVAGAKTYSKAVDMALRDFVRRAKARRILELAGSGLWEGDLAAMRKDRRRRGSG
jgi:Arc/MetJ family transcription regulator